MLNRNLIVAVALLVLLAGCDTSSDKTSKVVLPEPDSAGAQLLKANCSSCHGAPSPAVHTAEEWPNVVYRMQEHRRMRSYGPIAPEDLEQLIAYLKHHAKADTKG